MQRSQGLVVHAQPARDAAAVVLRHDVELRPKALRDLAASRIPEDQHDSAPPPLQRLDPDP